MTISISKSVAICAALWVFARVASAAQTNSVEWNWTIATPESQGMSSERLKQMTDGLAAHNTTGLLVVRNDKIVCEWYAHGFSETNKFGTASMAKGIVAGVALGVMLTDGKMSLDDKAAKFIPQWQKNTRKSQITIRELGSHTSGLDDAEDGDEEHDIFIPHDKLTGWKGEFWRQLDPPDDPFSVARDKTPLRHNPGDKFGYSNPGIAMLVYAMTAALKDSPEKNIRELLRDRVMRPIGVTDSEWSIGYKTNFDVDGLSMVAAWGGATYTARAAARVGRLLLRQGDWEGRQLLSPEAVHAMATHLTNTPGPCGLGWWTNTRGRMKLVPRDAYWGFGNGQRILFIVPSLNLIAVRFGQEMNAVPAARRVSGSAHYNLLFKPLMEAIMDRSLVTTNSP